MKLLRALIKSRNTIIVLLSVIIIINPPYKVKAQSQLSIGPVVGINFSTFKGSNVNEIGSASIQNGFYAGGFFNYRFSKPFSLQTEIIYTRKGAEVLSSFMGRFSYVEDYVEIPVLLKFHVHPGKTGLYLFAGSAFAINVWSNIESLDIDRISRYDNDIRKFDVSLIFGAGIDFPVSKGVMDISFRYNTGLTYMRNNQNITNNAYTLATSYGFIL